MIRWKSNGTGGLKFLRHTGPIQRWVFGGAATLALSGLAAPACYEAKPLRLSVVSVSTFRDCERTVDQVFFDAAYVRANSVDGPDLFYTPRLSVPGSSMTMPWVSLVTATPTQAGGGLGWGIGVWLKPSEAGGHTCAFELESLSTDLGGGSRRIYSPQRGDDFDRTLKEMAERLTAAFETPSPPG
ncbi:MAG TPA: hypothetical protein VKZ18_25870 [Polyangia bacterium]|nr:hypothetical protein [Polyangia bacterium]